LTRCRIDLSSPTYLRSLRQLRKKYRNIEDDLAKTFRIIEGDHETPGAHAVSLHGFGRTVWKYDCRSSDLRKHPRECFRIVAVFLDDNRETLYPIILYFKGDKGDTTEKEIKHAMRELRTALERTNAAEAGEVSS